MSGAAKTRVALVRFSSLGDVVLVTAAVEALAAARPDVEIDIITKVAFGEVFATNPHVRRVLLLDEGEGIGSLARRVNRESYDWLIDLHGNLRSGGLRFLVRGPRYVRYRKGSIRRRVQVLRRATETFTPPHVVDRYIGALAPLGVSSARVLPRLYPGEGERTHVQTLLARRELDPSAPRLGLAPGARWATKAWPEAHWIALARRIAEEGWGLPLLVGSAGEKELCARIAVGSGAVNLAGETTILQTAALLGSCRVLVTNDSAPMHIATGVGTPVVALFGPTVRDFGFYPIGPRDAILEEALDCRPCDLHGSDECPEGHHRCLADLAPDRVAEAVARALEGER